MIDLEFLQSLIRAIDESGLDHVEIERGGTRVRLSKSPPVASSSSSTVMASVTDDTTRSPGSSVATSPAEFEPSEGDDAVTIDADSTANGLVEVTSPMVGTFYRSPGPDSSPYAEVGSVIAEGDTLCIIEAMKLMNELEAELSGTVVEVCAEDEEPVEYGQVLFRVEPT